MVQTFTVNDMTCQGCARTVTQAVSQLNGVQHVSVDLAQHRVEVDTDTTVVPETIVTAINAAGYVAVTPEAPAALPTAGTTIELTASRETSGGCSCCS